MSAHAYVFYRPFPAGALTTGELVRFALRGCRRDIALLAAMGIGAAVLGLFTPIATGLVFNHLVPSAARTHLTQVGVFLVACACVATLFQMTRAVAVVRLDIRIGTAIQAATWDRLLTLPMRFFRGYAAGDLAVRAGGLDALRQALSGAAVRGALNGALAFFNFLLLLYYDQLLALWAAALIAIAAAFTVFIAWMQLRHHREVSAMRAKTSGLVLQLLTGIGKVRVAGAEVHAFGLWTRLFSRQRAAQFRTRVWGNYFTVFQTCFSVAALTVIVAVIPNTPGEAQIRVGDFVAFMAAFGACLAATLSTGIAALHVLSALPQYEMARPILTATPECSEGKVDPGPLGGEVTIDHVVFRYQPDGPPVLNDVTMRVAAGQFVALVGPSGSGKSTMLRLLLGFDAPETGSVYFDAQDLQGLDLHGVRRQMGVVLQDGRLTPGDIYSQIVGSSGASVEQAWEAATMVGLDEDIREMPMGMHTVVSEGGSTLSGGQRQRLFIARALVGRPRILLLDEATSALDNRTQAIVRQSLACLRATRIVIAHRLSTITDADHIYVIERGRVVQDGTYDELVQVPGTFAELARRQLG